MLTGNTIAAGEAHRPTRKSNGRGNRTRGGARTVAALVGMAALTLAVAACGPEAASGSSGSTASTAPATSTAPGSSTGPTSAPPAPPPNAGVPVTSAPGSGTSAPGQGTMVPLPPYTQVPAGQISETGMSTEAPTAVQTAEGGRIVIFHAEQSGCQTVDAQVLGQSSTQVVIGLVINSSAGAGRVCPMIVRVVPVTATLSAPLGSRTLVFQETVKH